jgi:hypothetical protein
MEAIYKNLINQNNDIALPVRVESAVTITKFFGNKSVEQKLKPMLQSLIQIFLNLMNEIESGELAESLQSLMLVFSDDILPFAV